MYLVKDFLEFILMSQQIKKCSEIRKITDFELSDKLNSYKDKNVYYHSYSKTNFINDKVNDFIKELSI